MTIVWRQNLVASVAAIAGALVGGVVSHGFAGPSGNDVVRARSFELVDDQNRVVGTWKLGAAMPGLPLQPTLTLLEGDGSGSVLTPRGLATRYFEVVDAAGAKLASTGESPHDETVLLLNAPDRNTSVVVGLGRDARRDLRGFGLKEK